MATTAENNKRIAKNTLLLYFRMLFMMVVSLYTSRVVLNTLGVEDFGIYNVVGGIVTMFTFMNGAMASATQRYLTFELGRGDFERLHKVFCTSMHIHALISLAIFILAETVGLWFLYTHMTIPADRMDAALWVYQFAVVSCIVVLMSVPYNASIVAHEKMSAFAYISILEVVLKLLIVYMLVWFDFDKLKLYAVLMFCVQIISRIAYGSYCSKHFEETRYQRIWDRKLFREMTGFAGWSLFGNLAVVAFTQGLNILLNMFFGPAVNAARGIAVQVQNAIQGFCANFQMALNPQITKNYASGDLKQMHSLVFASSKYSFFLLFFLSLPVIIEAEQILMVWLKIVPAYTVNFVRLILCIIMVDAVANPLIVSAQATGKIKTYQAVVGGILLLIVPVAYLVLKLGGMPESAFAVHFVFVALAQIARVWMIRPMIRLSVREYVKKVVCRIAGVVMLSVILPVAVYEMFAPSLLRFLLVGVMCVVSVGMAVYFVGLQKSERFFVVGKIKKIIGCNRL